MSDAVIAPTATRWVRTLRGAETLAHDLDPIGVWVGPRTGSYRRTKGDKEDYILRRLLVAWKLSGGLRFPFEISASRDDSGVPDFVFAWTDGSTLGVEVTEAGEEEYQRWLTMSEPAVDAGAVIEGPLEASTARTVTEFKRAIGKKVTAFDRGSYRETSACDLLVYNNTAWGGPLDKREIVAAIGHFSDLKGRFRQIHVVFGGLVYLDVFGGPARQVDVRHAYEIDYADWIFDQVERLRRGQTEGLDLRNLAEELSDVGKSERRAVESHLETILLHLLKWQYQSDRRGPSWRVSIVNAREALHERLTESPSLTSTVRDRFELAYRRARRNASAETHLPETTFPETCPYRPADALDPGFFPAADR